MLNVAIKKYSEALIILGLFILSFLISFTYLAHAKEQIFYQSLFEPAIHLSCGHDFGITDTTKNQVLIDFLALKTNHITCEDLDQHAEMVPYPAQRIWYYMLFSTALIWKLFGITWTNVNILVSLLFSFTICFSYGLYRRGGGILLSLVAALSFCFCIQHQLYLIFLRDYSAAPFLLGSCFLIALLVTKTLTFKQQLLLVATLGLLMGFGYGFRSDVIVLLPYACISIFMFTPAQFWENLPKKLCLLFILLVGFILASIPVLSLFMHLSPQNGTGTFHFLLLGLGPSFTQALDIFPNLYYDIIYQFNDSLASAMTITHGYHALGTSSVLFLNRLYDLSSLDLYQSYVFTFPYDFLLREISSLLHILHTRLSINFFDHVQYFPRLTIPASGIAALLLLLYNPKIGVFAIFTLVYLCAYPGLVFQERHYFFLYFLYWWPIVFILSNAFLFITNQAFKQRVFLHFKRHYLTALLALVLFFILSALILFLAYTFQNRQISKLITAYLQAPTQTLPYQEKNENDNAIFTIDHATLLTPLNNPVNYHTDITPAAPSVNSKMIKITFDLTQCQIASHLIPLEVNYSYPEKIPEQNFSHKINISTDEATLIRTQRVY